jgi:hypothetical protein
MRKPMSKRALASILFFLTACAPSRSATLAPQPVAPISPGDRLRVTHNSQCCTSPAIGIEQSQSGDSLVLQQRVAGMPRLAIARSNITRIERWNRGQTNMFNDAMLGMLAGAATGALIGYQSACGHCDGDWRPLGAMLGVIVGGGTGLVAGTLVGANRHGFWESVPISAR